MQSNIHKKKRKEVTTTPQKDDFRKAITLALQDCGELKQQISVPADKELCTLYMQLENKKGFWRKVGDIMGKPMEWAEKHYFNCFRKALFPEQFTKEQKEYA